MKAGDGVKRVWMAAGLIAVLSSAGCSDPIDDESKSTVTLPKALGLIQGRWESVSTNGTAENCGITIEDYSIRLRYQDAPDSPMERHSSVIDRVDEQGQVLIINGDLGVWPYFYGMEDGEEHLEVEFFSQQHGTWKRMHMRRSTG